MDRDSAAPSYTFRDHDLAAKRLALVAETFSPLTIALLNEAVTDQPSVAVDLGCGLRHSTRTISTVATPRRIIGLDQSETFLSRARKTTTGNVDFIVHDVTRLPIPGAPADLLFCRFLLVHLPEPEDLIQRWLTQLKPGGLLLVQETEGITSVNPTITRYLEVVEGLLASRGASLNVGPRLAGVGASADSASVINRTTMMSVPISRAASMFDMNLQAWHDDPYILNRYSPTDVAELEHEFIHLTEQDSVDLVQWTFREMTLRRPTDTANATTPPA